MRDIGSSALGEVCIPNIGPSQRRLRLLIGVVLLVAGTAVAVAATVADAPKALRLAAFLPLWLGSISVVQAREKT